MKKIIPILFLTLVFIFVLPLNVRTEEDLHALTANKEDAASQTRALEIYRERTVQNPGDYGLRLEAADTVYYLAHHITDKDQKRKILGEGIEWAKQAIALNPQGAGGHLFYGMLTGMRAEVSGIIEGLKSKDVIKREMEKVIELDPTYSDGDAYLALGQWYALVPFFMGGSSKKAQENLSKAVEINPNRTMPHLALAEFYSGNLQYDMAKQEIDRVLAIPIDGKNNFEAKRDQQKARELLKKIVSRLSTPSRGYQQGGVSSSSIPSTP